MRGVSWQPQRQLSSMTLPFEHAALYVNEIHSLVGTALMYLGKLDDERQAWLGKVATLGDYPKGRRTREQRDQWHADLEASGLHQTNLFDYLEAFLATWARLSLILFPTGQANDAWKAARSATLLRILAPTHRDRLENRDLRNSWMHFDERLDAAIREGRFSNRQRFTKSADFDQAKDRTLRLLLVDTGEVWFYTENGDRRAVSLDRMREALTDLSDRIPGCLDRL